MDADVINNFDWSREAGYEHITVKWDTPTIFMLLQCMHGVNLSLSSSMVAPLLQVLINSLSIQGERTTPNLCRSDFFMLRSCHENAIIRVVRLQDITLKSILGDLVLTTYSRRMLNC